MIWFTADWHFDHDHIIDYCKRPFKNAHDMNHVITDKYNSRVNDGDIVYVVGDVSLLKSSFLIERHLKRLKGTKFLILGNHDKLGPFEYVDIGFVSVHTALEKEGMIMVHDPAVSCIDRNKLFLCGHIHELFKVKKNVINVGVDVWDFFPVSLTQIIEVRNKEVFPSEKFEELNF